jgi:serine protease Do
MLTSRSSICLLVLCQVGAGLSFAQQPTNPGGTPYLGISNRATKGGVLVAVVQPGSPAEKAGVLKNDILMSADGTPLKSSADLSAAVRAKKPGEVMALEVLRGQETLRIKVVVGSTDGTTRATPGNPATARDDGRVPLLGVAANPSAFRCVLTEVAPDSAAHRAGFRVGDLVRRVNGERVGRVDELAELLGARKPGEEVDVEIIRNGESITVRVALGN